MKLYKLTDQNNFSKNNTIWGENITNSLPEIDSPKLCSKDLLHAYETTETALIFNYIHSDIKNPSLWEVEGNVVAASWDQVGSFSLKTIQQLPIPEWFYDENIKKNIYSHIMTLLSDEVFPILSKYYHDTEAVKKFVGICNILHSYLNSSSITKKQADNYFRDILKCVYDFYDMNRKNMLAKEIADAGFVVFTNIFCKMDDSKYYVKEHIAVMIETAISAGITNHHSLIDKAIQETR